MVRTEKLNKDDVMFNIMHAAHVLRRGCVGQSLCYVTEILLSELVMCSAADPPALQVRGPLHHLLHHYQPPAHVSLQRLLTGRHQSQTRVGGNQILREPVACVCRRGHRFKKRHKKHKKHKTIHKKEQVRGCRCTNLV